MIDDLLKRILKFRKDRDWEQFHDPKNLATSISIEASELLEIFQWIKNENSKGFASKNKAEIAEEMADVFIYLQLMAHDLGIDLIKESMKKVDNNSKKYPVKKSKGRADKYTKLSKE